jgi:hypothetical protein
LESDAGKQPVIILVAMTNANNKLIIFFIISPPYQKIDSNLTKLPGYILHLIEFSFLGLNVMSSPFLTSTQFMYTTKTFVCQLHASLSFSSLFSLSLFLSRSNVRQRYFQSIYLLRFVTPPQIKKTTAIQMDSCGKVHFEKEKPLSNDSGFLWSG